MKFASRLFLRLRWINLPGAMLVALLQRTPVARLAVAAEEMVAVSPVGTLLRSAFMAAASLGTMHAQAGATQFVFNPNTRTVNGTVGQAIQTLAFSVTGAPSSPPGSFRVTGLPPGLTVPGANASGVVNGGSALISGTPTAAGNYSVSITAYEFSGGPQGNSPGETFGPTAVTYIISAAAATAPTITSQPASQTAEANSAVALSVSATGSPTPTVQWQRNGVDVSGATNTTLSLSSLQPADAGIYRAIVTNSAGTATSDSVLVGVRATSKVVGAASEIGSDIQHPNGNVYDQVLLTGNAATVRADPGQVLRTSYIDLNDDIVQVEFAGAGSLTLALDPASASGPAAPVNYNQDVAYMKGHATIVIADADETTNVSVFSVGRANAVNQALFKDITYDGLADIALIAIASSNGKFAGVRTANTSYFATHGFTGLYAPGVQFVGSDASNPDFAPVFIGDISAFDSATPVILLGSAANTSIRGGDLFQNNGFSVQVSGLSQLKFLDGSKSSGALLPAQMNQGVLMQNGTNVTNQVVVNPGN